MVRVTLNIDELKILLLYFHIIAVKVDRITRYICA